MAIVHVVGFNTLDVRCYLRPKKYYARQEANRELFESRDKYFERMKYIKRFFGFRDISRKLLEISKNLYKSFMIKNYLYFIILIKFLKNFSKFVKKIIFQNFSNIEVF